MKVHQVPFISFLCKLGMKLYMYLVEISIFSLNHVLISQWPSQPGTIHFLIGKFSYLVIRFLLNSSTVKSNNEIGKVNDKKKSNLKI